MNVGARSGCWRWRRSGGGSIESFRRAGPCPSRPRGRSKTSASRSRRCCGASSRPGSSSRPATARFYLDEEAARRDDEDHDHRARGSSHRGSLRPRDDPARGAVSAPAILRRVRGRTAAVPRRPLGASPRSRRRTGWPKRYPCMIRQPWLFRISNCGVSSTPRRPRGYRALAPIVRIAETIAASTDRGEVPNERPVDLHAVPEASSGSRRGVPRPEVVDRDGDAHVAQELQLRDRLRDGIQEDPFRDLDLEGAPPRSAARSAASTSSTSAFSRGAAGRGSRRRGPSRGRRFHARICSQTAPRAHFPIPGPGRTPPRSR